MFLTYNFSPRKWTYLRSSDDENSWSSPQQDMLVKFPSGTPWRQYATSYWENSTGKLHIAWYWVDNDNVTGLGKSNLGLFYAYFYPSNNTLWNAQGENLTSLMPIDVDEAKQHFEIYNSSKNWARTSSPSITVTESGTPFIAFVVQEGRENLTYGNWHPYFTWFNGNFWEIYNVSVGVNGRYWIGTMNYVNDSHIEIYVKKRSIGVKNNGYPDATIYKVITNINATNVRREVVVQAPVYTLARSNEGWVWNDLGWANGFATPVRIYNSTNTSYKIVFTGADRPGALYLYGDNGFIGNVTTGDSSGELIYSTPGKTARDLRALVYYNDYVINNNVTVDYDMYYNKDTLNWFGTALNVQDTTQKCYTDNYTISTGVSHIVSVDVDDSTHDGFEYNLSRVSGLQPTVPNKVYNITVTKWLNGTMTYTIHNSTFSATYSVQDTNYANGSVGFTARAVTSTTQSSWLKINYDNLRVRRITDSEPTTWFDMSNKRYGGNLYANNSNSSWQIVGTNGIFDNGQTQPTSLTNIRVVPEVNLTYVKVNYWNQTGTYIDSFNVTTVNGNNVTITRCGLTAGEGYPIYKDSVRWKSVAANSSGCIQFNESVWSEHNFKIGQSLCTYVSGDWLIDAGRCVVNNSTMNLDSNGMLRVIGTGEIVIYNSEITTFGLEINKLPDMRNSTIYIYGGT